MSNEFLEIRKRAREKRDKLIETAREEYEHTLLVIAKLERELTGKEPRRRRKTSACVESVIPSDRTFTLMDLMISLEALDPGRVWAKRSVDQHICRLRARGLIRRIRRARGTQPALYARIDFPMKETPFKDMTLVQVITAVLTRPMTATEVAVSMIEAGYDSTMHHKALRDAVALELRKGRFTCAGGKWVIG